jgi:hypothetical protein
MSASSSVSFVKELMKEYQSIKDARRALNVIGLNAREDMDAIEEDALEKLNALKKEAMSIIAREEEKKKKKKKSWVRSLGRKVIVERAEEGEEKKTGMNSNYNTPTRVLTEKIQTRRDEEEDDDENDDDAGRQPFSLAYLEAYESSPSPSAAAVDDEYEYKCDGNVTPSSARHEKRSSFDFGTEDDKKWPAVPPMTVPRVAFRRDEYYYDGGEKDEEEQEEGTSFTSGDEEFEFSRSASYEETRVTSSRQQQYQHGSLIPEAKDGENSVEREDWWFNVSTPAPPAANKEEKKNHLTPEQVLESFDMTENKEAPFNSSMKESTVSPLYASPAYSYEKQFEDALRFLGAMDLRTFKEQLVESKIDAVITEASASALGNLTNGTPSRADAWRTRVDVACEMLESAGAEAASEALMAKARALAAEVLKRR